MLVRLNAKLESDLVVCDQPEGDGGDVERVGDEVYHIPHVIHVLPQAHVPQLLDLTPDETCTEKKRGNKTIKKITQ